MKQPQAQLVGLPFADFLRTWFYTPLTIWRDTFANFYHPQLFLGCNIEDTDDEYNVLNEVGSYGKQISQIQRVLDVLLAHLPADLTPEEQLTIEQFRAYEAKVNAALTNSRGPRPAEVTPGYVDRLGTALETRRRADPEEFKRVLAQLKLMIERQENSQALQNPPANERRNT